MARLVGLSSETQGNVFELGEDDQSVGRGKGCSIQLKDSTVSRNHATLRREGAGYIIEDAGSSFGTFLNGRRVGKAALTNGAELRFGQSRFRFEDALTADRSPVPESPPAEEGAGLTIMHALDAGETDEEGLDESSFRAIKERLQTALDVSNLLQSAHELNELFGRLLDKTLEVCHGRAAMVLFWDRISNNVEVQATRGIDETEGEFSHTIVDRVLNTGESLMIADTGIAGAIAASDSIMRLGIRSAMCVPLRSQDVVIGAIVVDAPGIGVFGTDDLKLLKVLGNIAGTAIVNSRLREEKIRSERMAAIGLSMTGLAHDIKNILSGVKAGAYLVDTAIQSNDVTVMTAGWDLVKVSQERLHQLTLNMLDWSKERVPKYDTIDLGRILEEVRALLVLRGVDQGISVRTEIDPQAQWIEAEAVSIHRCALNLASNAMDAMAEGSEGRIVLRTRPAEKDESALCVDVEDNGQGIPPDVLPRLFEAFTSTKGAKGTGLGLAVSQKIAREHGGTLSVQSTVGVGTVFTLTLPRRRPSATKAPTKTG